MAHLYISSKGIPWRKHSYSAGNIWDNCPYAYYLQKVLGYRERESKARFALGKAFEDSIQYHHEHDGKGAVEDFVRRWSIYQNDGNLSYTTAEKDWATCNQIGQDWVRLYQVLQPKLPVPLGGRTVFQREYAKEVFPGDVNYGGIEDAGRLDMVCYVEPDHPMLPKIEWKSEYGPYRAVIADIKTAGQEFPEQPGMAALDAQLRRYSWLSGIRTVALLWFVKKSPSIKKGYSVTLLKTVGNFIAGEEVVVAGVVDGLTVWVVKTDFMLEEMERIQGKKGDKLDQSVEAEQRRLNWLHDNGALVSILDITKQKLQFNSGIVSESSANDAGRTAARQIVEIVNACKTGIYPQTFGIRYPKDDRNNPYFRAFVLGDEMFKKHNFTKVDEESFDDLFNEETE